MRLLERAKAAGAVRADLATQDLSFLFEQLASIRADDEERTRRHRYLALLLDALRPGAATPFPGPAPSWEEIARRWQT